LPLDGFTFAPDAAEAGSDAKGIAGDRAKSAAGKSTRAPRNYRPPPTTVCADMDATIRWTGDAVAKLVAATTRCIHRPLISDDRLTGAPREAYRRGSICG